MKIARLYGLKYPNPKSSEAMILYHLKHRGIARRDPAEHSRKATKEVVDAWVKRYECGESLRQIAGDEFSPVTVFEHLRKRGVKLRDKVEEAIRFNTKHHRTQFNGSDSDREYLLGFVWGDCAAERHGRGVRIKTGTTHPEFVNLFKELFEAHGNLRSYPKRAKVTPAEMNLEIDIDGSFEFLLMKKAIGHLPDLTNSGTVLAFVAGFFDAEGCITFHRKGAYSDFEVQMSNSNGELLAKIQAALEELGYHPTLYRSVDDDPQVGHKTESVMWKLALYRHEEVKKFLAEIPLRHKEKVTKARLALAHMNSTSVLDSEGFPEGWRDYLDVVKRGCDRLIHQMVKALKKPDSGDTSASGDVPD